MNFARGTKYQNSAIVHCQNQLNEYYHSKNTSKEAKEKEARWQEWMASLDERIRRRREGQGQQQGEQEEEEEEQEEEEEEDD